MIPDPQTAPTTSGPPDLLARATEFLSLGGVMLWLIAALSVATLALILWKALRLWRMGAFGTGAAVTRAVALWEDGAAGAAMPGLDPDTSARGLVAVTAMRACLAGLAPDRAEDRVERVARARLTEARAGLRGLELAATVGPLLGLLGTVTGMIAAFQGLEAAGVRADTASLAGGIWEALLTTAAGMGVAIPAMIALAAFDGVVERLRTAMEADATRILDAGGAMAAQAVTSEPAARRGERPTRALAAPQPPFQAAE